MKKIKDMLEELEEKVEEFFEWGGVARAAVTLGVAAASLVASWFWKEACPFDPAWIAVALCGLPIVLEGFFGLVLRFDVKADVLVGIALVASVLTDEVFAAGEVAFIMQIGEMLEEMTVARARAGIERLVGLTPRTAHVVEGEVERTIDAEKVEKGMRLRVRPGETVPVDGVIVSGSTSLDQSALTGESMPVDKAEGDAVASGAVNRFGAFEMEATRVGEDSSIQRMVRLVQRADAAKAKIVRLADRWATWVVAIAVAAAAGAYFVTGDVLRSVTVLVVFCPCSLVLATPTAIMAAIGNATRHGFLVREGDALERLAGVRRVAFDKTGTLTKGEPEVVDVRAVNESDIDATALLLLAASAESPSEHPLGKAIVRGLRSRHPDAKLSEAEKFTMTPGRGVEAVVGGRRVAVGRGECESAGEWTERGCTVVEVSVDGTRAGFIALSDMLRPHAKATVHAIRRTGTTPVLLTGDADAAARTVAAQLDIEEVRANCMPEHKLAYIEEREGKGDPMCMVGDGINDAPALKAARVGVAIGLGGSDLAVEAADIALVGGDLVELPHLIALARRTRLTILFNLSFSMGLNFLAIALAIWGVLNPVTGALVHNAGSIFVILNSAFLLKWTPAKEKRNEAMYGRRGPAPSAEKDHRAGSGHRQDG